MLQNPRMANCGSCVSAALSVLDPHHLAFNELPPPVHIEQVTADDKIYDASTGCGSHRASEISRSITRL
jgi:hypothetical protein